MPELIYECLGALVAVVGFGLLMNVPRRFLFYTALDGAIGWFAYLIAQSLTGSLLWATFVGALVISLGAHICARIFKAPVTLFLIPANTTLVPGAGMYRIVYYILKPQEGSAGYYLQETLLAAGSIAVAIFLVNILFENKYLRTRGK